MPFEHDRAFYRLQYPLPAAPSFVAENVEHRVVDLGEGGFRYALAREPAPNLGERVAGVIRFPDDSSLEVDGVVVRYRDGQIAVHCDKRSIPLGVVLREQQRVRKRYPFRG